MKKNTIKKLQKPNDRFSNTEASNATKYLNGLARPNITNPFEDILVKLSSIESINNAILEKLSKLEDQDLEIGDIKLAEKLTGYARQTIYQLVSNRKIPFLKKQGKLFFSKNSILNWLREDINDSIGEVVKEIKLGKL